MLGNEVNNEVDDDFEDSDEELLFVLSGPYLYAECYLSSTGKMYVDVRTDQDEELIESIPIESKSKHDAMQIAFNATIGKE